jgi:hypothetical protein
MKRQPFVIVLTVAAGAVGFLTGRLWKAETTVPAGTAAIHRSTATPEHFARKTEPGKDGGDSREAAVDKFALLSSRAVALTPEQFGQRYAELLSGTDSADSLLERAAMLATIDADRATACYLAYKKRLGASFQQNNQEIRHLLTVAGERDGAKVIAAMQKAAPGFQELSSLVHGWAMKNPAAAVEWYNNLPDNDAQRKTALDGLMWGLSQRDTATTRKVYLSLSPEDQLSSGRSLGRALFTSGGGAELDRLMEGLSPEATQQCLQGACERVFRRAPSECTPWLASHLGVSDLVNQTFVDAWSRWSVSDPIAAEKWRAAAAQSNPRIMEQPITPPQNGPAPRREECAP